MRNRDQGGIAATSQFRRTDGPSGNNESVGLDCPDRVQRALGVGIAGKSTAVYNEWKLRRERSSCDAGVPSPGAKVGDAALSGWFVAERATLDGEVAHAPVQFTRGLRRIRAVAMFAHEFAIDPLSFPEPSGSLEGGRVLKEDAIPGGTPWKPVDAGCVA